MPKPPIFLAILAIALVAACDRAPTGSETTAPAAARIQDRGDVDRRQAGLPAPDAVFADPQGEPVRLSDLAGKPVLVNLWATWCAPCVAELPTLDALAAREAGRISVVTISQDSDGENERAADKVDAFFERMKFARIGAYLDRESAIMAQLGIGVLPTTILYDAAGREVWRVAGEMDWAGPRAARLIAEAAPGKRG